MSFKPKLPEGFKYWRPGACVPAVITVLDQLVDGRDWIIEGEVKFAFRDACNTWHHHTWMEVDGEIFDPTLIQFKRLKSYRPYNVQRESILRSGVREYRRRLQFLHFDALAFWRSRVREFGGVMILR